MVESGIPQALNPALLLLSDSDVFLHERIFKVKRFQSIWTGHAVQ